MSNAATTLFDRASISISRRELFGLASAITLGIASSDDTRAQDATPVALASPVAAPAEPLPYLFIQTSDQGGWESMRGRPGTFLLSMKSVSPQTIVIRDTPSDSAGTIETAEFFDAIQLSLERSLQAVVSVHSSTGEDVLVVSLFRADFDAAFEELVYVAAPLNDYTDQHGITPLQGQSGNFTLPGDFGATTLFITGAYCRSDHAGACQFG